MARRIGKGLSELLANIEDERVQAPAMESAGEAVYQIDLESISPNPDQPRKYFNEDAQRELQESIKVHGILQPLILAKRGDGYIIVAGERRYRAAKAVGMATVPALVKRIDDSLMREISLIENLQREDLNPIEEAEAIDELIRLNGYTQEKLAQRIGKARSSVTNILRLLGLDDEVKELVRQNRLSAGHARALAAVANREAQVDFAFRAADGEMSVRELEQRIKFFLHPETAPRKLSPKERERLSGEMRAFVDDMKRVFATKVKLVGNESKGRIYIDYFSRDDLERIYELIEKLKNI
ncbi:MAG TPA: ParB/RepB/Spo0J family partition protein [Candidatus Stercoripulliclostridium merdigallinarum]|uniref:ParB/RepB/Spo0J family partition protein n=1 Tax=Candidatus Stercoripulliclostridium merdigallinarum TaxID=2840951 RepID=A0A9D1MGS2_9FIRM|nr:ParB/RepB/Spo0J family partition protein [Candidatus Stercoripulliclostridium merdigallinarum]